MRILVVGAGGVGGYFGGRMALAGQDVTFLVREARARALAANGLVIKSPRVEVKLADVKTVLTTDIERGSSLTASMLRDIENGQRTEGDHVLGDLLARGMAKREERAGGGVPTVLELAYTHVKASDARHER